MEEKYYVVMQGVSIWYKHYKTSYGWTKDKKEAWRFTKRGANEIASRLNKGNLNGRLQFYVIKAEAEE